MPGQQIAHEQVLGWLTAIHEGRADDVPVHKRQEAQAIVDYWPWSVLSTLPSLEGAWHVLYEPTTYTNVTPQQMAHLMFEYVYSHGQLPKLDTVRRWGGRASNHRLPGEGPGQEQLL